MERWWAHDREVYRESDKLLVLAKEKNEPLPLPVAMRVAELEPLFVAHSRAMACRAATAHNIGVIMSERSETR